MRRFQVFLQQINTTSEVLGFFRALQWLAWIFGITYVLYVKNFRSIELDPEPEFLNILKCNSAESVSAGFQLNFLDIFNDKINI